MEAANADFSGWATKAGLKCADGRTISTDAFASNSGRKVPLVWQHGHGNVMNVLGHAILENRKEGVYCYGFFNNSNEGRKAKEMVQHRDIQALSIYADKLVERNKQVFHGEIREVSLVLSGANPGAVIENVNIRHSDGSEDELEEEVVIFTGLELEFEPLESDDTSSDAPVVEHAAGSGLSLQEVYDSLTETQKTAVDYLIAAAASESGGVAHSADTADLDTMTVQEIYDTLNEAQKNVVEHMIAAALETASSAAHSATPVDEEGNPIMANVFENGATPTLPRLSHAQIKSIVDGAEKIGSFKESFIQHAVEYGIENIDLLFPDAKSVTSQPELIARRTEWVSDFLGATKHSPFSRIKSFAADLTAEEARAKGYVKGNQKKDEIIKLLRRITIPTTIYKKQKLDRDDIVDITDLDVVAWLKWEMRFMLEEELARAILIGDGREPDDDDKINEDHIRPIAWDDEMYAHPVTVPANVTPDGIVESIIRARKHYKGTGTPTFYTTEDILTDLLLIKDRMGRRVYDTVVDLAAALRVKTVVSVEVMEDTPDLLGVMVNPADYTIGADKGGEVSMFDDFDIDFNQFKYLIETRVSGALTKPKSAVIIKRTNGTTVTPTAPTYNPTTHVLTIPTVTGVTYYDVTGETPVTLSAGNTTLTRTTDVEARPNTGYNFPHNTDNDWTYAYTA